MKKVALVQFFSSSFLQHNREACKRLAQWGKQWRGQAPQSVATLERDFEQTLVFYEVPGLVLQWVRTTSLLERTNRELLRNFRQAIYLQVRQLHTRWADESWWETSHALFFEFWNIHS